MALYNNLSKQAKFTSSVSYPDDLWHNLLLTYNGSQLRFFVDGAETGSPATLTGPIRKGNNFYIGYSSTDTWKGTIDKVYIWNRTLSAEERQYLQSHLIG